MAGSRFASRTDESNERPRLVQNTLRIPVSGSEPLDKGYYDTPRQCSLTDLADTLDVSKSTASIVLHNAEETIIKEFFAEAVG